MTKSRRHTVGIVHSWTTASQRRWFSNCDARDHVGQRRQLVADYFEGYLTQERGWMYICSTCMVEELSDRLATAEGKRG